MTEDKIQRTERFMKLLAKRMGWSTRKPFKAKPMLKGKWKQ